MYLYFCITLIAGIPVRSPLPFDEPIRDPIMWLGTPKEVWPPPPERDPDVWPPPTPVDHRLDTLMYSQ